MYSDINVVRADYEKLLKTELSLKHTPVEISEEELDYVESICHSVFGAILQYGWHIGEKNDVPSIELGIIYSAFVGMVAKQEGLFENKLSPEDFFNETFGHMITQFEGRVQIKLNMDDEFWKQCNDTFDVLMKVIKPKKIKIIDNYPAEKRCLEACMAMYFYGKGVEG